jgi:O-antigen/teichoic acid export membrane protein
MSVSSGMMFLAEQSDRLIFGKLAGLAMLGVYNNAWTFASIPREGMKRLSFQVIFPAIAKYADLPRPELRAKILKQRWRLLLMLAALLASMISVGDLFIGFVYDQRYQAAAWMMPILCTGFWFSMLSDSSSPALLAIGKPLYSAQSSFVRLLFILIGLPLGYYSFGVLGAVIAVALSDMPTYCVYLYGLSCEKLQCFRQDLQATACFMGMLASLLAIRVSLGWGYPIQLLFNQ